MGKRAFALTCFLPLLGLALSACDIISFSTTQKRVLEVAPYKQNCFGLFETLCLRVRESGEIGFSNLFETPVGFAYEWGYDYVILVEEHELDEVPADGSSIRRVLDLVVSKSRVDPGTRFDLVIPADFLIPLGADRYALRAEPVVVECGGPVPCDDLATLVQSGARLRASLSFSDRPGVLEVLGWLP